MVTVAMHTKSYLQRQNPGTQSLSLVRVLSHHIAKLFAPHCDEAEKSEDRVIIHDDIRISNPFGEVEWLSEVK